MATLDKDCDLKFGNCSWEFDENVSKNFDCHVNKSVPCYKMIHDMIGSISEWFIVDNTNVYDIGTSNGNGLLNIKSHNNNKKVKYIGVDKSSYMINEAKKLESNDVFLINNDVLSNGFSICNSSFITSVLTLQFIPKKDKFKLVKKIYDGLEIGGAFILVEKILVNNSQLNDIFVGCYYDFKKDNGFSEEEILNKSKSLRSVMQPLEEKENTDMLEMVGFKNIEVFFKWFNFIGIIAIK